jgi:hypothetical protein
MPRSWRRSSTLRNESGYLMYIITTSQITPAMSQTNEKGRRALRNRPRLETMAA